MTSPSPDTLKNTKEARLPRRDWIILPLLSLMTILLLLGSTELIARMKTGNVSEQQGVAPCIVSNDLSTGVRFVPNSECRDRIMESGWTDYKFNSHGHRAGWEYGPKEQGTYRIVMAGSSIAFGFVVDQEKSFSALLPGEISARTGRKVELYNESMGYAGGGTPHSVLIRFDEILAARPDAILWVLTPYDLENVSSIGWVRGLNQNAANGAGENAPTHTHFEQTILKISSHVGVKSIPEPILNLADKANSQIQFQNYLKHFLYQSQSLFVSASLNGPPEKIGFLNSTWGPIWTDRLHDFDSYAGSLIAKAGDAGIPVIAVFVPDAQLAAIISKGEWPAGDDPFKLDRELGASITRHGGTYIDILPDFQKDPNSEEGYFRFNGHPDATGHANIAKMIAREITGGAVPALNANAPTETSPVQVK
jgi:hypothetical protein